MAPGNVLSDPETLTRRIESLAQEQRARSKATAILDWPPVVRGAPNVFLRSALFAAVQGKTRKVFTKRTLLASTENCQVRFQGVQLDQSDFDVWMEILHLARNQLPGFPVTFRGRELLKAMNRGTGNKQYQWLADSVARLGGALVELTFQGRHTFGDHLLRYYRDESSQRYVVELTDEMTRVFLTGYTHLEWTERQALMRKPLTLWLHGFICSHAAPYPLKVTTLYRLSGGYSKCLRGFKNRLGQSLQELLELGIVSGFEMTKEGLVTVTRNPSPTQARSLARKGRHKSTKSARTPRA
ncbi:MAG: TrfA protein [Proteobacteria bacterium]|nr:TrfA protein [Pseudomonadota bacterium]